MFSPSPSVLFSGEGENKKFFLLPLGESALTKSGRMKEQTKDALTLTLSRWERVFPSPAKKVATQPPDEKRPHILIHTEPSPKIFLISSNIFREALVEYASVRAR